MKKHSFMRLFILALLVLGAGVVLAQKPAKLQGQVLIDSLLTELPRQKEDTNKCNMLFRLAYAYYAINPDEGLRYAQQCEELATNLDWKKGKRRAFSAKGYNYGSKSDYPKALDCYLNALRVAEEIGNKKTIAEVTTDIGELYKLQSDYPRALDYYFKSLKLQEEAGDSGGNPNTHLLIGNIYLELKNYQKALDYYQRALKLNQAAGDKGGIAAVTCNIGIIYAEQNDFGKALEYFSEALKLDEETGNKIYTATVIGDMAEVYMRQGNYIMSVETALKSLKINEELGNKEGISRQLGNIGSAYISMVKDTAHIKADGRYNEISRGINKANGEIPQNKNAQLDKSIDYLQRGVAVSGEVKALDILQGCYESLAEAFKLKRDYRKAMEYADSSRAIKDSLFSQENREKVTNLGNKRKEYGDSLKSAEAKRTADVKAMHRRNYEYIGVAALIVLLCFILVLRNKNKLLDIERKQSETLLLNILPEEVAGQLKKTGSAAAKRFDNVTVLFTDFVDFTKTSDRLSPEALVEELDACFKKFDEIVSRHGIEKIKTIGDAYLSVCGLPNPDPAHAENVVKAAKEISAFMQDRHAKLGDRTFEVRIGVHSGSVVAGIVGNKKFAYDIWGDTVNTAARMEQNCEPGRINISEVTYELVKDKFSCEYRGEIEAKGKGMMRMYYVSRES